MRAAVRQRGAPEVVVEDMRERGVGQEVLILEDGAAGSNKSEFIQKVQSKIQVHFSGGGKQKHFSRTFSRRTFSTTAKIKDALAIKRYVVMILDNIGS